VKTVDSFFFVIDLKQKPLQFSDENGLTWIQGLPLGTYDHPLHGRITITPARIANFVRNFHDKVREIDLDIDYEHKEFGSQAAGWVVEMEDRGTDGLWLQVEWTPKALQALRDKEYRYFSPEFADVWKHPKSGQKFKDVVFGGAITNRPFLKDIMPINLSEFGHEQQQGDKTMDELLRQLSELLGLKLADDADDATATAAVTEAITKLKEPKTPEPADDEAARKLAESNPAVAKLLAENQRMRDEQERDRKDIRELMQRNRLSEVTMLVNGLDKPDQYALSPVAKKQLSDVLVTLPDKQATDIITALTETLEKGIVKLGETGRTTRGAGETGDVVKRFHDTVAKLQEDHKLSYADACERLISEDRELFDAYNNDQLDTSKGRGR
jgi:hypothetical protein